MESSRQLRDLNAIYFQQVAEDSKYGYDKDGNSLNPVDIEKRKKEDDDLAGAPKKNGKKKVKRWWDDDGDGIGYEKGEVKKEAYTVTAADKKGNTPAYQAYKAGKKNVKTGEPLYKAADHLKKEHFTREEINDLMMVIAEKQKDTPDQVKAVIAYDKARKGTEDAVYDTEHGKKKQAKKERDYAKWQRDKGAEDAQKSGHPWEHAKGSTREKEGKKSEKHAHIKDSFEADLSMRSKEIQGYADAYEAVYETYSVPAYNGGGLVKKEVKALKKGAETLKGKNIAKADKVAESIGSALDKGLSAGADAAKAAGSAAVGGVKVASKVVKKTAGAAGRVAGTAIGAAKSAKKGFQSGSQAESVEIQSLINSGIFSEEELNLFVWNEFDESREYSHNPEKYHDSEGHDKKLERDKPYRKRSKAARMADPERGINSPAFRKFMADRGM